MLVLRKVFDVLLYSNLFIGLCAVALSLSNQLLIGESIILNTEIGFVFAATVFIYSFLKFRNADSSLVITTHQKWSIENSQLSKNIVLISLLITASLFLYLSNEIKMVVLGLAVATSLYGFVTIPFIKPAKTLRDFGLFKTFFVAAIWSVTTVLIPLSGRMVSGEDLFFLLIRRFLFVLALTLMFEIKDLSSDEENKLETLPMLLGVKTIKRIAQAILVALILITLLQYVLYSLDLYYLLAINLSLLVSIFFIQFTYKHTTDTWFYFILDGMMILQFAFIYLVHWYGFY